MCSYIIARIASCCTTACANSLAHCWSFRLSCMYRQPAIVVFVVLLVASAISYHYCTLFHTISSNEDSNAEIDPRLLDLTVGYPMGFATTFFCTAFCWCCYKSGQAGDNGQGAVDNCHSKSESLCPHFFIQSLSGRTRFQEK